jgi:hypothetical protein
MISIFSANGGVEIRPSCRSCIKEARIAALLRNLAGCAARGVRILAVVFDRRAT